MWRFFARYKTLATVLLLLFIPIFFLYSQKKTVYTETIISGTVLDSFQLLQRPLLSFSGKISDIYYRYWSSVNTFDELISLRSQIKEVQLLKISLIESEIENQRLRSLIDFAEHIDGPAIVGADITGRTGSPLSQSIQINKGSKNGINRGDGVVGPNGAIGQVYGLGKYSSKVLLMTDASSAIDVIVERSRAHGIMRGASDAHKYSLKVKDFDRLHDVEIGDIIVTSGVGAKFPTGIPVGTVTAVRFNKEGLYVEADIKPFIQFDQIEEVLVLTRGPDDKIWRRKEMALQLIGQSISQESI